MFKKKPTIKALAPLRSSDRRRTADDIIAKLEVPLPETAGDSSSSPDEQKTAEAAARTALRNSLLPENTLSARFTTTRGADLSPVSGTIYVAAHDGHDQRILWLKVEDVIYPTVYTLWKHPTLLPLLHTPRIVVEKMQGGADLMAPGLGNGPPFPSKAKKGSVVAVASLDAPTVPLVIGSCEIDISSLTSLDGVRGHAVRSFHWYGDELWSWSATGKAGVPCPAQIDDAGGKEDADVSRAMENLGLQRSGAIKSGVDPSLAHNGEQMKVAQSRQGEGAEKEVPLTTKEIDDAFWQAFLFGVHRHKESGAAPNYGLTFPLTQSFVMGNLIHPFLPAHTSSQTNALQMKKTSWKNIKKLVKALDKAGILKSKDRDGHEVVVLDIDFNDRAVTSFVPYRLPKKDAQPGASTSTTTAEDSTGGGGDDSIGQRLIKRELYKPKPKLLELFPGNSPPSVFFSGPEMSSIISTYIETEHLLASTNSNKRLVTLNAFLSNHVFDGSSPTDNAIVTKGTVNRDTLTQRVLQSMSPFWTISRAATAATGAEEPKPKPGHAPRIHITQETRTGNKTATKISGVEAYLIAPALLAEELRRTCAGATSVERLAGSPARNPVMEIMVQGPQRREVERALERRGVSGRWIEFVDKTKKGKK